MFLGNSMKDRYKENLKLHLTLLKKSQSQCVDGYVVLHCDSSGGVVPFVYDNFKDAYMDYKDQCKRYAKNKGIINMIWSFNFNDVVGGVVPFDRTKKELKKKK